MQIQAIGSNFSPAFSARKRYGMTQKNVNSNNLEIKNNKKLSDNKSLPVNKYSITGSQIIKMIMDEMSEHDGKPGFTKEERQDIEQELRDFETHGKKYKILANLMRVGLIDGDRLSAGDVIDYLQIMSGATESQQFAFIKLLEQYKKSGAGMSEDFSENFFKPLRMNPELIPVIGKIDKYLTRNPEIKDKAEKAAVLPFTFNVISQNPELADMYKEIADKLMDGNYWSGLMILAQYYTKDEFKELLPKLDKKMEDNLIIDYNWL